MVKILDGRYWYSKKHSCDQKTSNLAFVFAKKRYMANEIILVLINIVMVLQSSLLVLLNMINIMLQNYYFLIYW